MGCGEFVSGLKYVSEWSIKVLDHISNVLRKDFFVRKEELNYLDPPKYEITLFFCGKHFASTQFDVSTALNLARLKALSAYFRYLVKSNFENSVEAPICFTSSPTSLPAREIRILDKYLSMSLEILRYPSLSSSTYLAECIVDEIRYEAEGSTPQVRLTSD